MKRKTLTLLGALLLPLALAGCVTHTIFLDLRGEESARYVVQGDSADMHDKGLVVPQWNSYSVPELQSGEGADGTPLLRRTYLIGEPKHFLHPIAPPGEDGTVDVERSSSFVHKTITMRAVFPAWAPAGVDTASASPELVQGLVDLGDDRVRLMLLPPEGWFTSDNADTTHGDTLVWQFTGDTVLDSTVVASMTAWRFAPGAYLIVVLAGLGIGVGAGSLVRRLRGSGEEEDAEESA